MSEALSPALLLDGLIAVLLVATIAYAVILNRKLTRLRRDRGEMEAVIARLIEATDAAQKNLETLRAHADQVGPRLQKELARAQGRTDELAFLIERAEAVSDRLERAKAAAPARPATEGVARRAEPPVEPPVEPQVKPSAGDAKLLKSLEGVR